MHTFVDKCHHGKEENYLFKLLEQKGVPVSGCPLAVLLHEHEKGRSLLADFKLTSETYIRTPSAGREALLGTLRRLIQLYPAHIWKEDYLLFPMTDKILSDSEQKELSTQFGATVVEHRLGWRAQFAYPKSLFLPPAAIPFTLTQIDARLKALIAFGTDIFIVGDHESIRFWKNGSGFEPAGLDYLIKTRKEYYVRRQWERTLKKGDRVAVLGRGIAVVEQADNKEALVVLWNRHVLRIARKDIVLNQQNMRWECEAKNALRKLSLI
jgi:hypothetical protein